MRPVSRVSGWGGLSMPAEELRSERLDQITRDAVLTRGLGRSYGDSSLPPTPGARVACSVRADRLLGFDPASGRLRAEAGLSLYELNRIFLPRRWFVPVTPGTQFVTLGGMVAADVHGKNHHRVGCFGEHVTALRLRTAGGVQECSPRRDPDLFWATIGGMGLTGHILEVEFRLQRVPSPWIWQETERVGDLDRLLRALRAASRDWPFTVAWADCLAPGVRLGRGIVMRGRWAEPDQAPEGPPQPRRRLTVPTRTPSFILGRPLLRIFNLAYYRRHGRRTRRGIVHPEAFFYPLDLIRNWNRLYGRRGFTQYQCVLPRKVGNDGVRAFLRRFVSLGGTSFLTVIKDCGPEGHGLLSFPMAGTSIALDLPMRADTRALVAALNETVIRLGGRIYLAKDALTDADAFRAMEPRLPRWCRVRHRADPEHRFQSAQSERLQLCREQSP